MAATHYLQFQVPRALYLKIQALYKEVVAASLIIDPEDEHAAALSIHNLLRYLLANGLYHKESPKTIANWLAANGARRGRPSRGAVNVAEAKRA